MVTKFQKSTKTLGLALCVGLLSSGAFVGQSFAAVPELSFYPASGWNVGVIDSASDTKICRLSNEFNNGYILQITGSERGINDFSVDFRQSVFEKSQSYNVAINIPEQIDITAVGVGYNEDILGVNLVGREGFIKAMGKSGIVDFFVEGNAFRFHMTGFAEAVNRFEACVAGYDAPIVTQAPLGAPVLNPAAAVQAPVSIVEPVFSEPQVVDVPVPALDPVAKPVVYTSLSQGALPEEDSPFATLSGGGTQPSLSDMNISEDEIYVSPPPREVPTGYGLPDEPDPNLTAERNIQDYFVSVQPVTEEVRDVDYVAKKTTKTSAKMEADFTRIDSPEIGFPVSAEPVLMVDETLAPAPVYNADLHGQIASLERRVDVLGSKKASLENDLQGMREGASAKRLEISSENWNLEHATMKFQEAERQVERLGRQIQRERARYEQDTSKLEAMLFDPAVTNTQQLARLSDLERQLDDANAKLSDQQRKYETRIQLLEQQLGAQ